MKKPIKMWVEIDRWGRIVVGKKGFKCWRSRKRMIEEEAFTIEEIGRAIIKLEKI